VLIPALPGAEGAHRQEGAWAYGDAQLGTRHRLAAVSCVAPGTPLKGE